MNPAKFDGCLREVRLYLAERHEVGSALLYGSVAVGTAGADSDFDLLIVAPRDVHEDLARDLFRIGARHDVTISPYLVERPELDALDPQFLEAVTRDGVAIVGEALDPSIRQLRMEPYQLVTLQLDRLPQGKKVALSRDLYGYESVRKYKRKTYRSRRQGFVEEVGGRKLGRGTFLIPARSWPQLEALLRRRGAERWAFTVWVQATS
ncbi:MAG TPA: nucleotidyltransferase domain-containing protein [Thermoplasmata archaeon]